MKKVIAIFLFIVLLVSVFPLSATADSYKTVPAKDIAEQQWYIVILSEDDATCAIYNPNHWHLEESAMHPCALYIPDRVRRTEDLKQFTVKEVIVNDAPYIPQADVYYVYIPETIETIDPDLFALIFEDNHPRLFATYQGPEENFSPTLLVGHKNSRVEFMNPGLPVERYSTMGWIAGDEENSLYWTIDMSDTVMKIQNTGTVPIALPDMNTVWTSENFTTTSLIYEDLDHVFSLDNVQDLTLDGVSSFMAETTFNNVTCLSVSDQTSSLNNLKVPNLQELHYDGTYSNLMKLLANSPQFQLPENCTMTYYVPVDYINNMTGGSIMHYKASPGELIPSVPDPSAPGYIFTGWYKHETDWSEKNKVNFTTDTVPDVAQLPDDYTLTLYAGWKEKPYHRVTVSPSLSNCTVTTNKDSEMVREDDTVKITVTPNTGYEFVTTPVVTVKDGSGHTITVTDNEFTMPTSNVTVTVTGQIKMIDYNVTVTVEGNGRAYLNNDPDKTSAVGNMGNVFSLTEEPDQWNQFVRFEVVSGNITINADNTFTIGTEDVAIKARFDPLPKRDIYLDYSGQLHATVKMDPATAMSGQTVKIKVSDIDRGYKIDSLTVKDDNGNSVDLSPANTFVMPEGTAADSVTVTISFQKMPEYKVIWLNGDGSELTSEIYYEGERIPTTDMVPTKESDDYKYVFSGWDEGTKTPEGETIYTPSFTSVLRKTYTIIWLNGDGSILEKQTYKEGDDIPPETSLKPTKSIDGKYSYAFDKWDEPSVSGNTTTYTPLFTSELLPLYNISISTNGFGTAKANPTSAVEGSKVNVTITPATGYRLSDIDVLEGDVTIEDDNTFIMGKANVKIFINFIKIQTINITFEPDDGTGFMSMETVEEGSEYRLPECGFIAPKNKVFFCWQVEGKTYQPGDTLIVSNDLTVLAVWNDKSKDTCTVTFLSDNNETVAVQNVVKGEKAIKPSDPLRDDYVFVGWYTDTTYQTPFTFDTAITSNMNIYAKWTKKAENDGSIEYSIVEGSGQKWTKNTANNISIRAKRNLEDDTTLTHFVALQVDGKALVKDTDYTVQSGSVIAVLKPSFLETLGTGIHRITFVFDDGKAETTLTIVAAEDGSSKGSSGGSSSSSSSSSSGSSNPSTGDLINSPFLWFGGMLMVIFMLYLFIRARKQRIQEALDMQDRKY